MIANILIFMLVIFSFALKAGQQVDASLMTAIPDRKFALTQ